MSALFAAIFLKGEIITRHFLVKDFGLTFPPFFSVNVFVLLERRLLVHGVNIFQVL